MNGIFRVSAASSEVTKLREAFDTGNDALVEELLGSMTDYHVAAHLIKQFFRELPDPLLTYECYDRFVECEDNVAQISAVVATLPRENILTLHYLMTFLARVATHEEESKMGPSNLAIVFGPTILRNPKENTSTDAIRTEPVIQVCQTMIEHCDEIFASIDTTPATSSSSSSRPSGHARAPSASGKRFGKSDMFACGAAAAAIGLSGLKKTNTNAAITGGGGGVGGSGGSAAAAGAVVAGRPSPATPKSPVAKRSLANSADVGGPKKEFVPVPKAQPVVKGGIRAGASSASFTLQKSAGPGPAGPAGGGGDMAAMRAELAKMRGNMEKLSAQCEEQDEKIKAQDAKIESQEEQIEELEKRLALAIEEKKKAEEENNGENGDEEDNEEDEEEKKKKEEEEEDGSDGGGDSNELDDAVKKKMEELEKMLGELKSVCDAQKKTIAANKKEIESLSEKVKKMDGAADEKQHKRHKSTVKKDDASPDIE